jgi:hypothetical protein
MGNPETKATLGYEKVQRQANKQKNTENWKINHGHHRKTGLTQVLAKVGHNGCFTSTFLDHICLILVF